MTIELIEEFDLGTQIKVIGVGGGGGNYSTKLTILLKKQRFFKKFINY